MDATTIIQIGGLLAASWGAKRACTPPYQEPSEEEKKGFTERKKHDSMTIPIIWLAFLAQVFIHIHNLTEALAVLAHSLHWQNVLAIFPQRVLADERLTLYQPERLIGLALILGGTFIRIDCYRRLQKNFTFQLAVREDHKLVTDGPYSYVRHPSYLGALMVSLGALLMNYGRGSFWFEHGFTERSLWVWLGVADVMLKYVFFSGAVKRCKLEDDVLKAHFQEQWIKWSKKTPYRMVPFVY